MDIKKIIQLRDITGLNLINCKNILIKYNWDINLVLSNINKENVLNIYDYKKNFNKKSIYSMLSKDNKYGILIKFSSETDFIFKNDNFLYFKEKILKYSVLNKINNLNLILNEFKSDIEKIKFKFKENISIDKILYLEGNIINSYVHLNKIGVLISSNIDFNYNTLKSILIQIAANNPEYIYEYNIPKYIIDDEIEKYKKLYNNNDILNNKIKDFIYKKTLTNQYSLTNNEKIIDLLNKTNTEIFDFKRLEI
ncbi:elongation factor Ts [endosymbiont of Sipalinus gigas]|uniref:hypothetical protein n=1 Tax=endosymbiont of Sipalinus gigas TaxID=1972134 RepID=UPI000DC6D292|nr:hypothetical protein [endosymbiont of Sipalinus gigas]BBA85295.1 elongation factor Ts [endosymbiont of Sipalinus gigas]